LRQLGKRAQARSLALHLLGRAQGIALMSHVYQDAALLRRETRALRSWIDEM
jgi:hypothetical protein